jgi:alkylation response protein AidB-like acyl-CoA dehydrogenase
VRFALTEEQRGFARSLDDLLAGAGTSAVARAWADGEHEAGLRLWRRLADLGVTGLVVPETAGGLGAGPVELVVAFEVLGRHVVPGPWVESAACLPILLGDGSAHRVLASLAARDAIGTLAAPPFTPFALDADVATDVFVLDKQVLSQASAGRLHRSADPARRLFEVRAGAVAAAVSREVIEAALEHAALACAGQLLGLGERLLAAAVGYAKQRTQFGRPIGEHQALKHALADVRVALDFTRPLLFGAALTLAASTTDVSRDVSAAKVSANAAATLAARTALQVHGAVGFTAEHDLGLALTKVRALTGAWGTSSLHRARVLEAITAAGA